MHVYLQVKVVTICFFFCQQVNRAQISLSTLSTQPKYSLDWTGILGS